MVVCMNGDKSELTPGQRRTLAARQARRHSRLERLAAELREHDYVVLSPEDRDELGRAIATLRTTHPELVGVGGHTLVRGVS